MTKTGRDGTTKSNLHAQYEAEKKKLQAKILASEEYDKAIREICKRLKI